MSDVIHNQSFGMLTRKRKTIMMLDFVESWDQHMSLTFSAAIFHLLMLLF